MSDIFHILWPRHPNHRGSKQSELQSLRCFYTFFIQRPPNVVYQFYHLTSWSTESWILTYWLPYLCFTSMTAYTYLPTSSSGYFLPLMHFITSRLGCLLFYGDILTLFSYTSMSCITFISELTALPTALALLSLFTMYRLKRHLLSVWLLLPCCLVLLDPFEVLSGAIRCDKMQNELWGGSATESLNIISCGELNLSWSI